MKIQFLIPVYNEHDNLPYLLKSLKSIIATISSTSAFPVDWEVLFADNNSTDGSLEYLSRHINIFLGSCKINIIPFAVNYGFSFSTSYLLSKATGQISVLIPADMQIPMASIIEAMQLAIYKHKSVLLCRNMRAKQDLGSMSFLAKRFFYKALAKFQTAKSYNGYYGMGCYVLSDLEPIKNQTSIDFFPFQIRIILPRIIIDPEIVLFDELPRFAGHTSFGLFKYFSEAISIFVRSDFITSFGIQIAIKSVSLILLVIIGIILIIRILFPLVILPGFTTVLVVTLISCLVNLASTYILAIRIENTRSTASIRNYVQIKKIPFVG